MESILLCCLLIFLASGACSSGQYEFTFVRTTTSFASEESLNIYLGSDTSSTAIYTEGANTLASAQIYTSTHCLALGSYTAIMGDSFGDGWNTGSYLQINAGGEEIATVEWTCARSQTYSCTVTFILTEPPSWQYTTTAQTGNDWKTANVTWPSSSSGFPAPTTTTRYFRRHIPLTGDDNIGILVSLQTDAGAVLYINGLELTRWNMPTGDITSATEATSSGDVVTHYFNQVLMGIPAPIDDGYVVAVEVHAGSTLPVNETFGCTISFFSSDLRLIDEEGSHEVDPEGGSGETGDKLYDNNVHTKWCVLSLTSSNFPTVNIWTFGNGDRRIMNKYALSTANDAASRDCVTWTIAGSNDGTTWDTLDTRSGITWNARYQTQYFEFTNTVAYNKYRWSCSQVYNINAGGWLGNSIQMSEWNLLMTGTPYVLPGISYPESTYNWSAGIDSVNLSTGKTGYTNWQIAGAGGASLPAGLTFNTNNGDITGIPTESLPETTFTVSATYSLDSQVYTTTITITVTGCDLPNFIPVTVDKVNYNTAVESWTIKNADGETVLQSDNTQASVGACLAMGEYTVTMTSSAGAPWAASSLMTISALADDHTFVLSRTRLTTQGEDSFSLSVQLPLLPASNGSFKYLADGTVPSGWYGASYNADSWSTLDASNRPSTAQSIKLFRATFNVASKEGAQGFELYLKGRNGIVAYINGNEVYRSYLESGDITTSTIPTGGSATYVWRRITGPISSINTGSNTIAVAVLTLGSTAASVDFDMHLRLLKDSQHHPRYWDYTTTGTTQGQADNLFDQNPSTNAYVSKASQPEQSFVIQFNNNGAEFFNKYCFVTNAGNENYDPREWTIQGSMDGQSFTTLKDESEVYFDSRSTSYCYYMPSNTKAWTYYRLTLKKARVDTVDNYYSLADWNLYLVDLSSLEIPDLSFTPNELTAYTGDEMPSATCSSPYYSTFSIQPALPTGISFSTTTGLITGIANAVVPTTTFTISALTPTGETKTTTITLTVTECSGDKISFTIQLVLATGVTGCSFQLKDRATGTVIEELDNFPQSSTLTIPMCRPATTYSLVLKKTDTTGWGSNKANVLLADGHMLLSESLAAGVMEREYNFNPAYSVLPQWNQWHYMTDGSSEAPSNWYTLEGAPASWATAQPAALPAATAVTQYYYAKFNIADITEFSSMDIAVRVKAGVIVYLNGEEIRRYNLPEGQEVTATTAATAESEEPFLLITGEAVQNSRLVVGENIIAFEMHRYEENEEVNSFDASAILILDGMYMLLEGVGSTVPALTGFEGSDKIFDNNSDTKMLTANGICEGVEMEWRWNDERCEPIARYGLVSGNDCNNRHPSGWTFSGSNDGENWRLLQSKSGQYFTSYKQQKLYNLYNVLPFNRYKLVVTECGNTDSSGVNCDNWGQIKRFQLADFYLFSKLIPSTEYCAAEGDYEGAMNGDMSYADCPTLYEGARSRLCVNGTFAEEVAACYPMIPQGISYEESSYTLTQDQSVSIPATVIGAEITCSAFPSLPAGLTIDATTCTISGAPQNVQESQRYTITATNEGGSIQTSVSLVVLEAPTNWTLIIIIIVVVVIVVVAIIVAIVLASKNKKNTKKSMPKSAKGTGKAASTKTTAVKPKTAVKV